MKVLVVGGAGYAGLGILPGWLQIRLGQSRYQAGNQFMLTLKQLLPMHGPGKVVLRFYIIL